jgi:hypothetical protein
MGVYNNNMLHFSFNFVLYLTLYYLECQDPTKADKITAIKASLDETKEIVVKNIESLLDRYC